MHGNKSGMEMLVMFTIQSIHHHIFAFFIFHLTQFSLKTFTHVFFVTLGFCLQLLNMKQFQTCG